MSISNSKRHHIVSNSPYQASKLFLFLSIMLITNFGLTKSQNLEEQANLDLQIKGFINSDNRFKLCLNQASELIKLVAYSQFPDIIQTIKAFEDQDLKFYHLQLNASEILGKADLIQKNIKHLIGIHNSKGKFTRNVAVFRQESDNMRQLVGRLQILGPDVKRGTDSFVSDIGGRYDQICSQLEYDTSQRLSVALEKALSLQTTDQEGRTPSEMKLHNKRVEGRIKDLHQDINLKRIVLSNLVQSVEEIKRNSMKKVQKVEYEVQNVESPVVESPVVESQVIPAQRTKRLHIIFLVDTSKKKWGDLGLKEALKTVQTIKEDRRGENDRFSLIKFGDDAKSIIENQIDSAIPQISMDEKAACSKINDAIEKAKRILLEATEQEFTPIIMLFTDGMTWGPKADESWFQRIWRGFRNLWSYYEEFEVFQEFGEDLVEAISKNIVAMHQKFKQQGYIMMMNYMSHANQALLRRLAKLANGGEANLELPSGEVYAYLNKASRADVFTEFLRAFSQPEPAQAIISPEEQNRRDLDQVVRKKLDELDKQFQEDDRKDLDQHYDNKINNLLSEENKTIHEIELMHANILNLEKSLISEASIEAVEMRIEENERLLREKAEREKMIGTLDSKDIDVPKGLDGLKNLKQSFIIRGNYLHQITLSLMTCLEQKISLIHSAPKDKAELHDWVEILAAIDCRKFNM